MTFRNLLIDELVVGTFPGGPYIRLVSIAGAPAILVATGNPNEVDPGSITFADNYPDLDVVLRSPTTALVPVPAELVLESDDASQSSKVRLTAGDIRADASDGSIVLTSSPGSAALVGDAGVSIDSPAGDAQVSGDNVELIRSPGVGHVKANGYPLDETPGAWRGSTGVDTPATGVVTTLQNFSDVLQASVSMSIAAGVWTPQIAGVWEFHIEGRFAANATGLRQLYARDKAGVDQEVDVEFAPGVTQPASMKASWLDVYNGSTDSFRWRVLQNSGAGLNWRTQRAWAKLVSQ